MKPVNYTIDPFLASSDLKVSMVLREVPFDAALKTIVRSVGATYTIEDGIYNIKPKQFQDNFPSSTASPVAQVSEYKVILKYLNPADLIPILRDKVGIAKINTISDNIVVITATPSAADEAFRTIDLLDTPDAAPRMVRVLLTTVVYVSETGKRPREYKLTSENIGRQNIPMPIMINFKPVSNDPKQWGDKVQLNLTANLTSRMQSEPVSSVMLEGNGVVMGAMPLMFNKSFNISVPVAVSKGKEGRALLTSGSLKDKNSDLSFKVFATVSLMN
jgi:hypothetical protein